MTRASIPAERLSATLPEFAAAPTSFGPRSRSALEGPEHTLVTSALAHCAGLIARQQVFQQPALETGFPDVVLVELSPHRCTATPARLKLTGDHLRLLHHLSQRGPASPTDVTREILWKRRELDVALAALAAADLVEIDGAVVTARPQSEIFCARRIIAIEAKMRDWSRAIHQAVANTWFASHSLILLPAKSFNQRVAVAADALGVGVLTFDGRRLRLTVKPQQHSIPMSYGSWLVSEWALRKANLHVVNAWARKTQARDRKLA